MTDLPDRTTTRFPESLAPEVSDAIDATLRDWGVDHRSVLLCGGARGSDLIAAESALALGARVQLCLALPEAEFVERSVDSPGTNWVARFEAVRDRSVVRVLQRDQGRRVRRTCSRPPTGGCWRSHRRWRIHVRVLAVWDQQRGDGHGGTASFVQSASEMGAEVVIIPLDPTGGLSRAVSGFGIIPRWHRKVVGVPSVLRSNRI